MANTKKNASNKKKLLSAVSMLTVSAVMLSTATYAWFTMSREVEVKNIQMTATVPEDIQISLGALSDTGKDETQTTTKSLAANTGYLITVNGSVKEPGNFSENWSNTADISNYYAFGKLIPASSVSGEDIFFTPDANGVGKTVDPSGTFYVAATAATAGQESVLGSGAGSGTLNATAFTYVKGNDKNSSGTWNGYKKSTAWNATYSDGYYVDIPVWLRTSSVEGADLTVKAYVKDAANADAANPLAVENSGTAAGEKLYRAVRVAVLDGAEGKEGETLASGGMLDLLDGDSGSKNYKGTNTIITNYYKRDANNGSGTKTNANNGKAVAQAGSVSDADAYADIVTYNGTTPIIHLSKGEGTQYGDASKYIIRVWLEGEDQDCWNDTAGQDWSINLMFENTTTK